jgi:hypothetical protein
MRRLSQFRWTLFGVGFALGACEHRAGTVRARELTLVIGQDTRGVLEPCGCDGEVTGSMDALVGSIRTLRNAREATLVLLGGEILAPADHAVVPGPQALAKSAAFSRIVADAKVDVLAPAPDSAAQTALELRSLSLESGASLIAASATGPCATALREVAGLRVGLLGACPDAQRAVRALRAQSAELVLGISHQKDETWASLPRADQPDAIIAFAAPADGLDVRRGVLQIRPGTDAGSLAVVTLRLDHRPPVGWTLAAGREGGHASDGRTARMERVRLGRASPLDRAVRSALDRLYEALPAETPPAASPSPHDAPGGAYVGSRTCAACHAEDYVVWRRSAHGEAYNVLERRHRQRDLECVPCHVTGFGVPGGSLVPPFGDLAAVGCEACHGPSGPHADDPSSPPGPAPLGGAEAQCSTCHDPEHSPGFDRTRGLTTVMDQGHARLAGQR